MSERAELRSPGGAGLVFGRLIRLTRQDGPVNRASKERDEVAATQAEVNLGTLTLL